MDEKYHKVIQEVNTILILKECFKFIGIIYYGLNKVFLEKEEFEDRFGKDMFLALTDGNTIYFKLDENFQTPTLIFIIIHEILHILSLHLKRIGDRDPILWNIACDHVVNVQCKKIAEKYGNFKLPDNCVLFEDIEAEIPDITAEILYNKLKNDDVSIEILFDDDSNESDNKGSGNRKTKKIKIKYEGNKNEFSYSKSRKEKNKKDRTIMECPMDLDEKGLEKLFNEADPSKSHEKIDIRKNYEKLYRQASSFWQATKNRTAGTQPDILDSYLDEIFKVEAPWDKLLENAILYSLQKKQRSTWTYPNLFVKKPRLPGKIQKSLNAHTLIAVIDSSGSISEEDLKMFRGVLISSGNYFKNIYVIIHDVKIQQIINIKNPNELSIFENLKTIKGRGGTSHREVFKKIEELVENEKVSSIVFLTDLYSDIDYLIREKDFKFLKNFHTIWMTPKNSFGKVKLYDESTYDVIGI